MSILSKIQALITAANAKTGESDTTLTDAVQTLVDGYGQGGGGSLPSVISAIDGGSFTLASDTKCSTYNITTTLNSPAARFLIWTEDLNSFEAASSKGLIFGVVDFQRVETSSSALRYGFYAYTQRNTNGSIYNGSTAMQSANLPGSFTGNDWIKYFVGDTYYIAGATYKWLAWA